MCKNLSPLERSHASHLAPEPNVTINMGSSTLKVSFPAKSKACIVKEALQQQQQQGLRQCLQELHSNGPFSIKIAPGSATQASNSSGQDTGWHPPECRVHGGRSGDGYDRSGTPEVSRCCSTPGPQQKTLHVPPQGLVISLASNDGHQRAGSGNQVLVTSGAGQGCALASVSPTQLIIKGGEECKVVNRGGSDNQLIIQSDGTAPSLVISSGGNDGHGSGCKVASGSRATQLVIGGESGCRSAPSSPTKVVIGRPQGTELVFSGGAADSGCALARGQPTRVTIETPSAATGCKLAGSCRSKSTPSGHSRPTTPSRPHSHCVARNQQRSYDTGCAATTSGANGLKVHVAGRPGMQVSVGSGDAGRCRASAATTSSDVSGCLESLCPKAGGRCLQSRPKMDMRHYKPTISFLIASRMTQLLKEMKRNAEIRANTHPYYHS